MRPAYQAASSPHNSDPDSGNLHLYHCRYGGVLGIRIVEQTQAAPCLQTEDTCYAASAALSRKTPLSRRAPLISETFACSGNIR
jgi:hypothetical protein